MTYHFQIPFRLALAFGVAIVADAVDFLFVELSANPLVAMLNLPAGAIEAVLDIITCAILCFLLGFHLFLLPSFILKFFPLVEAVPSWTACVALVAWAKRREAAKPEAAQAAAGKPVTPNPQPDRLPTLAASVPANAGKSNLWYLAAGVCVVAGLIWLEHRPKAPPPVPTDNTIKQFAAKSAQNPNPLIVVAPIENESTPGQNARRRQRRASGNNLEKVRTVIEEMLTGIPGTHMLERQQAQVFLSEWGRNDGMSPAQRVANLQTAVKPNLVVMVAITDLHDDNLNYKGYGITAKNKETHCSLRLQIVDMSDGSIVFSRTLDGVKTVQSTSALEEKSTEDSDFAAIQAALQKLDGDAEFQNAVRGVKQEQVEIEIAPKPDNCDIEIDGNYVGDSPLSRKLLSGHEIKIRISKAGFRDWEKRLSPQTGLRVTPELEPTSRTP